LAAAGICLFWVPVAYRNLIYQEFVSDIYASDANNWLLTMRALADKGPNQQHAALQKATSQFRRAIHTNVFSGAAYEGMASANNNLGGLAYSQIATAAASGSTATVELLREAARGAYENVITYVNSQITNGELRYHYSYYLVGHAYRMLWMLDPDPSDARQMQLLKSAREGFEKAIDFNMADNNSLFELAALLDTMPNPDPVGAGKYRRQLFQVDPGYASRVITDPLLDSASCGATTGALERLRRLQQDVPGSHIVEQALALAHLYACMWPPAALDSLDDSTSAPAEWRKQILKSGWQHLQSLQKMPGQESTALRIYMLFAAAEGDFANAEKAADGLLAENPHNPEAVGMKLFVRDTQSPTTPPTFGNEWHADSHRCMFRICFGQPREKRAGMIGLYSLFEQGLKTELPHGLRTAQAYLNNGNAKDARTLLERMAKLYAGDSDFEQFVRKSASAAH
jgi:hypothetical protein